MRNVETVKNGVKSDKIEKKRELGEGSPLSATLFLIATIDVNEYTDFNIIYSTKMLKIIRISKTKDHDIAFTRNLKMKVMNRILVQI